MLNTIYCLVALEYQSLTYLMEALYSSLKKFINKKQKIIWKILNLKVIIWGLLICSESLSFFAQINCYLIVLFLQDPNSLCWLFGRTKFSIRHTISSLRKTDLPRQLCEYGRPWINQTSVKSPYKQHWSSLQTWLLLLSWVFQMTRR